MSKLFYPKFVLTNLKKNGKIYFPYLLTGVVTVMMYYIMNELSRNSGIEKMLGASSVKSVLSMAKGVVTVFAAVFLFYTNSFLVKRRKKEFGLYQVLGMDKRNITKMMTWETFFTAVISIGAGLLGGILLGKLMYLILLKMMHFDVPLEFMIVPSALWDTMILFTCIFAATLLFNLIQVKRVNPIELLHGGNHGEKEPKTKWLLALCGIVCTGTGYFIALTTKSPLEAVNMFFIAVILVILGTYGLFTAGSIALLKLLRKNKGFYYQTRHFTSVAGMIYRMKQNAVGLSNICILSTVLLVLISTSVSLYTGMEDIMETRFPTEYRISCRGIPEDSQVKINQIVAETMTKNVKVKNKTAYKYGDFVGNIDKNSINLEEEMITMKESSIIMIPERYYNEMEGDNISLKKNEVVIYYPQKRLRYDTIKLNDEKLNVVKELKNLKIEKNNKSNITPNFYMIIAEESYIQSNLEMYNTSNKELQLMNYVIAFDLEGDEKASEESIRIMNDRIAKEVPEAYTEDRDTNHLNFYSLYGSFLFIGIFLGGLFLMATVLIIYYKQISEGYDDKERYQIMQKVGMSKVEVKRSIKSQVLSVFFLPLVVAVIHIAAAFPVITKLLAMFNLVNISLFLTCTIITVIVFAVFYAAVFAVTAREYYKIVQ